MGCISSAFQNITSSNQISSFDDTSPNLLDVPRPKRIDPAVVSLWNERIYDCRVGIINLHHSDLFLIIANLIFIKNNVEQSKKKEKLAECILNLELYAKAHFAYEEMIYVRFVNPSDLEIHRRSHAYFTSHIHEISSTFVKESVDDVTDELISYVSFWINQHILHDDRNFFVNKFGYQKFDFDGNPI